MIALITMNISIFYFMNILIITLLQLLFIIRRCVSPSFLGNLVGGILLSLLLIAAAAAAAILMRRR